MNFVAPKILEKPSKISYEAKTLTVDRDVLFPISSLSRVAASGPTLPKTKLHMTILSRRVEALDAVVRHLVVLVFSE